MKGGRENRMIPPHRRSSYSTRFWMCISCGGKKPNRMAAMQAVMPMDDIIQMP